jgi:hypothetical protein
MLSMKSLSCGFVFACVMIYGTQIASFIAFISYLLWRVIKGLHIQWEDAQNDLSNLQPNHKSIEKNTDDIKKSK